MWSAAVRMCARSVPLRVAPQSLRRQMVRVLPMSVACVNVHTRLYASGQPEDRISTKQDLPREAPRMVRAMAKALGVNSKESQAIRVAKNMYEKCYTQAQRTEWNEICKLPDTFMSWFFLTHLHVWLTMVRLQTAGPDSQLLCKEFYEVFWEDVEHRIRLTGVENNMVVTTNVKELNQIFWGCLVAYDEGLLYDDIALASALWRNMFDMRPDTDVATLARMVGYIRREALALDKQDNASVLAGNIAFGKPPLRDIK